MDIYVYAFAFIAVIFTLIGFVLDHPLTYLSGQSWRRTNVCHKSTQLGQTNFALKEGQTLVGVIDTTRVMCFYIAQDPRDEQSYE